MIKNFLALIMIFCSLNAYADEMLVTQVLKGDTVVASLYGSGNAIYVHIAGVDAPELNQQLGPESRQFLSNLVLNKRVVVDVFRKQGNHYIGRIQINYKTDVGNEILKAGMGFFKQDEANIMMSAERVGYPNAAQSAKFSRRGVWASGDYGYTTSASGFRSLQVDQYDQQYVNGVANPSLDQVPGSSGSFNRPGSGVQTPNNDYKTLPSDVKVLRPNNGARPTPSPSIDMSNMTSEERAAIKDPGDWRDYKKNQ